MQIRFKQLGRTALAALLAISLAASGCARSGTGPIRIGTPGGAAGVFISYVTAQHDTGASIKNFNYDMFSLSDCCSPSTLYALLSLEVDAAVLCPDAAERLIAEDSRYVNLGPLLVNSDVVVVRDKDTARKIGIAQQRWYQAEIARRIFGPDIQIEQIMPTNLGFTYETGVVDGVVIDVQDSVRLEGERISVGDAANPVVTYVLVALKSLPQMDSLIASLAAAAARLNNAADLQAAIEAVSDATGDEVERWQQANIAFVPFAMVSK